MLDSVCEKSFFWCRASGGSVVASYLTVAGKKKIRGVCVAMPTLEQQPHRRCAELDAERLVRFRMRVRNNSELPNLQSRRGLPSSDGPSLVHRCQLSTVRSRPSSLQPRKKTKKPKSSQIWVPIRRTVTRADRVVARGRPYGRPKLGPKRGRTWGHQVRSPRLGHRPPILSHHRPLHVSVTCDTCHLPYLGISLYIAGIHLFDKLSYYSDNFLTFFFCS